MRTSSAAGVRYEKKLLVVIGAFFASCRSLVVPATRFPLALLIIRDIDIPVHH